MKKAKTFDVIQAATSNDLPLLDSLLATGVNLNQKRRMTGKTIFEEVILEPEVKPETLQRLLDAGASIEESPMFSRSVIAAKYKTTIILLQHIWQKYGALDAKINRYTVRDIALQCLDMANRLERDMNPAIQRWIAETEAAELDRVADIQADMPLDELNTL